MDVKISLTKLVIAFFVLRILAERKGNHPDQSAFFARRKWTLAKGVRGTDGIISSVADYHSRPSVKNVVTDSGQHSCPFDCANCWSKSNRVV